MLSSFVELRMSIGDVFEVFSSRIGNSYCIVTFCSHGLYPLNPLILLGA